ncbi:hypothetical protein GCM10007049_00730 [Echinicola pacifica]|uniref:N-acetyltransferase domain-containing protein n=1 Tax=Echinicola pacifica TaxID=346377 RepID=A0A918PJE9_9BACT|nr:GNAT family N-acetyltransferase [Echinicola pacifica]GGZ12869.1 hypothetical protein GCM10007049_00730 [Echinicola pacifica]
MQLRNASPSDLPAIVELLKTSLGESLIPKSIPLWRWKHEEGPFGQSPVILAEHQGKIVGVRAFMPWKWQGRQKNFASLRAVDTAVHPDYQGQGIFKKLSLSLVQKCTEEGYDFIFNSPNKQSLPGYLKMGWEIHGRLPLQIALVRLPIRSGKPNTEPQALPECPENLLTQVARFKNPMASPLHTVLSPEYLRWRYKNNPLYHYGFLTDEETYLCVFRIKSHSRFDELRICDLYLLGGSDSYAKGHLQEQLAAQCRIHHPALLSGSGIAIPQLESFGLTRFLRVNRGPLVTMRNLNCKTEEWKTLMHKQGLAFSIGDLELF